jgi:hypothetical protein
MLLGAIVLRVVEKYKVEKMPKLQSEVKNDPHEFHHWVIVPRGHYSGLHLSDRCALVLILHKS